MADSFHHGNLRRALLDRAVAQIAETGPAGVSMRTLAAAEGVSHAAPRHHFGSREGLLTAVAAEGYERLADALTAVRENGGSYADLGVAYVRFAEEQPGYFAVMFDADQLSPDDPHLRAAEQRAFAEIERGVRELSDGRARADLAAATIAGWAMMHGLVSLSHSGSLDRSQVAEALGRPDLTALAARVAVMLHGSPGEQP